MKILSKRVLMNLYENHRSNPGVLVVDDNLANTGFANQMVDYLSVFISIYLQV